MKVVKKKTIRKKLIKAIICTVITAGSMCNAFATVPICAASAIRRICKCGCFGKV